MTHSVYAVPGEGHSLSLLSETNQWGILELDLAAPPSRFWADTARPPQFLHQHMDAARLPQLATPAQMLANPPAGEGWTALSRRAVRRLEAWFLLVEDPQRRLDAAPIETLAHQASLVRHVLESPNLSHVLIADEVGLGKTVEAGLIIKHLLAQRAQRVLYLAPAMLVRNVHFELHRLELNAFRKWVSGSDANADLKDPLIVASIHRATHPAHVKAFESSGPWDVIIVDECHHLTDWQKGGGKPVRKYQLVDRLLGQLSAGGRVILLSGTPHQGHRDRFKNLLKLLREKGEEEGAEAGRVIYRTKDDVQDWEGHPLFPQRQINPVTVIDLGARHRAWLTHIHEFYVPTGTKGQAKKRAAGWRCAQALQWATSSIHAGLGYLIRQAIRIDWTRERAPLPRALAAIRPYRDGRPDEPLDLLYARIQKEIARQTESGDVEDIEEEDEVGADDRWTPDPIALAALLEEGVSLLEEVGDEKWRLLWERLLAGVGDEKVVLFAQPIETVTALRRYLRDRTKRDPAIIIGNQDQEARQKQVEEFWRPDGAQFLISSRAGGEGINLQCARRLVHVDVPWNPMELEQRVGRVHRIGSRRTIIVDTLVVKDSREEHAYSVARGKLKEIASSLRPERFEALFARVMSLVPPTELSELLGESALSPLSDEEQGRIADLVTRGFEEWREFDEKYKDEHQRISQLDAGQARWSDLRRFCETQLDAQPATGFSSLRFRFTDGEVTADEAEAQVLRIDGTPFACGDYLGVPVVSNDGVRATKLGLNVPVVGHKLRDAAFPGVPTGAAHLRWPEGVASPVERPFGALLFARQAVRFAGPAPTEAGITLYAFLVDSVGNATPLEAGARATLVRNLLASPLRRDAPEAGQLVTGLHVAEGRLLDELRRPGEEDRQSRTLYAVTPLFAGVIT